VESGAGDAANFSDDAYRAAGAEVALAPRAVGRADIVFKVRPPSEEEVALMREAAR
jgi:NAD(P) transhydrogenase subunit alpha